MAALKDLSKEQIIKALKNSSSLTEVCTKLNAVKNGGNRNWLRKFILENNLDVSHFNKIQNREEYAQNPKHCKCCGKELDWNQRNNDFCSRSCSASFNNKNRTWSDESKRKVSQSLQKLNPNFDGTFKDMYSEKLKLKDVKVNKETDQRICKNCGKVLNRKQAFYCSVECQYEFEQRDYIYKWKQGLENGLSGEYGLNKRIRKYMLDKSNYKCELCGWGERNLFTNTVPLEIHHKDGDYTNNNEENLQVLCPNCHSLTETYKSHNKDGRKSRNKYSS